MQPPPCPDLSPSPKGALARTVGPPGLLCLELVIQLHHIASSAETDMPNYRKTGEPMSRRTPNRYRVCRPSDPQGPVDRAQRARAARRSCIVVRVDKPFVALAAKDTLRSGAARFAVSRKPTNGALLPDCKRGMVCTIIRSRRGGNVSRHVCDGRAAYRTMRRFGIRPRLHSLVRYDDVNKRKNGALCAWTKGEASSCAMRP